MNLHGVQPKLIPRDRMFVNKHVKKRLHLSVSSSAAKEIADHYLNDFLPALISVRAITSCDARISCYIFILSTVHANYDRPTLCYRQLK